MSKMLFPLLILSLVACCIEVDISVPSFPDMSRYFDVGEGVIQLTIAVNFLGFCLAALFYGPLSDCVGRRKLMIIGNALLAFGAVGCVFAPSIGWLLAVRFIQGVGASASCVLAFAMIADAYAGEGKAAKLIGIMNSVLTILMAGAPILGGFINDLIGWRGNYSVVAIVSVVSWLLLFFFLPETKKEKEELYLKKIGKDYLRLFTSSKFLASSLVPSLFCGAYMSYIACASFLYKETYSLPTVLYALLQGSIVGSFSIVSLFSGRIVEKFGSRQCIIKGTSLGVCGAIGMLTIGFIAPYTALTPYLLTLCMIIFCIGLACSYSVVFASSLEVFPDIKGTASSGIMSIRAFLCSAAVGIMGHFYDGHPLTVALVFAVSITLGTLLTVNLLRTGQFTEAPKHVPEIAI